MRTAPFAPYPLFVLPMPDDAARALARALHERGEAVGGVNGALPAARVVAEEMARLAGRHGRGRRAHPALRARRAGRAGAGRGPAAAGDAPTTPTVPGLVRARSGRRRRAGRPRAGARAHEEHFDPRGHASSGSRPGGSGSGRTDGRAGAPDRRQPAGFGVARVGPVYTPQEHRGRGYASAAVAEVSRRLLDEGARVCLFTDQANPTSNRIYEALGYRPVVDMANLAGGVDPAP